MIFRAPTAAALEKVVLALATIERPRPCQALQPAKLTNSQRCQNVSTARKITAKIEPSLTNAPG